MRDSNMELVLEMIRREVEDIRIRVLNELPESPLKDSLLEKLGEASAAIEGNEENSDLKIEETIPEDRSPQALAKEYAESMVRALGGEG